MKSYGWNISVRSSKTTLLIDTIAFVIKREIPEGLKEVKNISPQFPALYKITSSLARNTYWFICLCNMHYLNSSSIFFFLLYAKPSWLQFITIFTVYLLGDNDTEFLVIAEPAWFDLFKWNNYSGLLHVIFKMYK